MDAIGGITGLDVKEDARISHAESLGRLRVLSNSIVCRCLMQYAGLCNGRFFVRRLLGDLIRRVTQQSARLSLPLTTKGPGAIRLRIPVVRGVPKQSLGWFISGRLPANGGTNAWPGCLPARRPAAHQAGAVCAGPQGGCTCPSQEAQQPAGAALDDMISSTDCPIVSLRLPVHYVYCFVAWGYVHICDCVWDTGIFLIRLAR